MAQGGLQRVIALIDMDCFYVQVEERECPEFRGTPCTVVQYRPYKGGGIIAVNYEARARGVKRGMMGDDAKEVCPEVHNFRVVETRGKADLTKYRNASAEVFAVLKQHCDCVERASIDEAYIDLTSLVESRLKFWPREPHFPKDLLPNTCVVPPTETTETLQPESETLASQGRGLDAFIDSLSCSVEPFHSNPDTRLAVGAAIVEEVRSAVYEKTQFRCSAGVAHNKILAKIACGVNKPNKQTILPHGSVEVFFATLPVHKLKNLGGKLGHVVKEELGCSTVGDLLKFSENNLIARFGERSGTFLYRIARGLNDEEVKNRTVVKSIGCSKNFLGRDALGSVSAVEHWAKQLCEELEERLKEDQEVNGRVFKGLTVNFSLQDGVQGASKACSLTKYCANSMKSEVVRAVLTAVKLSPVTQQFETPVIHLGAWAGKEEKSKDIGCRKLRDFFTVTDQPIAITPKQQPSASTRAPAEKSRRSRESILDKFVRRASVETGQLCSCAETPETSGGPSVSNSDTSAGVFEVSTDEECIDELEPMSRDVERTAPLLVPESPERSPETAVPTDYGANDSFQYAGFFPEEDQPDADNNQSDIDIVLITDKPHNGHDPPEPVREVPRNAFRTSTSAIGRSPGPSSSRGKRKSDSSLSSRSKQKKRGSSSTSTDIKTLFGEICEKQKQLEIPEDLFTPLPTDPDCLECRLCAEVVSAFDSITHRDFHVASNLHKKLRAL